MCSIGEDDFGDEGAAHTMIEDPKVGTSAVVSDEVCKKCNENKVAIKLNLKDAQCEPCFYQYVRHKLRAAMGATKIIERDAKVLLVFDGTVESCVLLHMIRYAITQEKFKRLSIQPYVVYVDESCIAGLSADTRRENVSKALKILEHFQFESYCASIAGDVPTRTRDNFELNNEHLTKEQNFVTKYNAIKSQTGREDFLDIARLNVYRRVAAEIESKYVFVPSISHQVATNLMVNVALGRGKSAANDISFCDNRPNSNANIIRPMRNINSLEIETYVQFDEPLSQLVQNDLPVNHNTSSVTSIQSLTKQFMNNLQENFASTVSTVFRTGDKISAAASTRHLDGDRPKATCIFCYSNLDYDNSSTLFAIEYSRCVSAVADQTEVNNVDVMLKRAENQVLGKNDDNTDNLIKSLCHGCRNIYRELNDSNASLTWLTFDELLLIFF